MVGTGCGAEISSRHKNCESCAKENASIALTEVAKLGGIATHTPRAEALRAETMRRQEAGKRAWKPSDLPTWLNKETYIQTIQPRLTEVSVALISRDLGISEPYATTIRAGVRIPHPRHWQALARIVGLSQGD